LIWVNAAGLVCVQHGRHDQEVGTMIGYPEAPKAWWLTRGMARISGVNLPRAVVEGWLQRTELEELVSRCAACGHGNDCESWLATSGSAQAMPGFCPNKPGIEALG
jgi:hypothetical protein